MKLYICGNGFDCHNGFKTEYKYYTSSGVSAGIDMALGFVAHRFGVEKAKEIAENIEYIWNDDPKSDKFAK